MKQFTFHFRHPNGESIEIIQDHFCRTKAMICAKKDAGQAVFTGSSYCIYLF